MAPALHPTWLKNERARVAGVVLKETPTAMQNQQQGGNWAALSPPREGFP